MFAIIIIILYPLVYGKSKNEKGEEKQKISQRVLITERTMTRMEKMISIVINHAQLKRALFNNGTPIIVNDFDVVKSYEETRYDSSSNSILLRVWNEEEDCPYHEEILIRDMISCISEMMADEDEDLKYTDIYAEFIEAAQDLNYIK